MDEESESHGSINGETEQRSSAYSEDCFKKRRKHEPTSQDRISTLPDSILLRILSFLPTEDAITTGVLSKRWAYLWTSVPSLSFDNDDFQYTDDVASAIDNTLVLHRAPKLTKFFVRFDYEPDLKPRLDLWLRFATTAKVDQLGIQLTSIDFSISDAYQLPQHLYANEFVSELFFSFCKIKPSGLVRWSSLTSLVIMLTTLCEDAIKKVLMGCPKLEYLKLDNCRGVNRLDIVTVSNNLRKLVIANYFMGESDDPVFELDIVAPKIESLEILGYFFMKRCRIKDVSSLVKAKLDFSMSMRGEVEEYTAHKKCQETMRELLESVRHVKELIIGKWCLLVLSIMSVKQLPSPLLKCKCLTMKTSMKKWDLLGIASLLQSSPYLETLDIEITSSYYIGSQFLERHYLEYCNNDDMSHWKSKEICFKSLLPCLKTVKIFGFEESLVHIKEVFISVVEFLLKNARVLEKMVIAKPQDIQNQRYMLHEFLEVAQKLLSIPRSSPHAVIMLPYQ